MKSCKIILRPVYILLVLLASPGLFGQEAVEEINESLPSSLALTPLQYLASDELMGRRTSRPEIDIAAKYISEQFRSFGLQQVQGTEDYFQTFDIKILYPFVTGTMTLGNKTFVIGKRCVVCKRNG